MPLRPAVTFGFLLISCLLPALILPAAPIRGEDVLGAKVGIIGDDDREIISDNLKTPWSAIGHVNIAGFRDKSICTGTLISPRVVMTAAHCLTKNKARRAYHPSGVHFLAGVKYEDRLGHSKAKCLRFHKDYDFIEPQEAAEQLSRDALLKKIASDLAVIVLEEPITVPPLPVARGLKFSRDMPLIHAAYPADRRFLLSADKSCKLKGKVRGLWATDCDTYGGSSGGPVLTRTQGRFHFAAVMVGAFSREVTIAIPIPSPDKLSLHAACPSEP